MPRDNDKTASRFPFFSVAMVLLTLVVLIVFAMIIIDEDPPDLVGKWRGVNQTVSDIKGFQEWEKTVYITEQRDRRFRGHFEYSEGRKDFFGVIHPDNRRFTWVASDSRGYNFGRVHKHDKISTCYVEPWEEATAGCAILRRVASEE